MVEISILAKFGTSSSKYSISQKLFSKLTSISPHKTHDNFQINIQKDTQIRKSFAASFSNPKRNIGSRLLLNKLMDLNHKIPTLNQ